MISTPDKRLRIFVSSTLEELGDERVAAREAIDRLRLSPVLFELGARPFPPRQLYRAYLAQSDIFIAIYWQSYGWVAPGETMSGLEDEYRLSEALPRLIYIKAPAPDRDPRLTALLELVQRDDRVSYKTFRSASELRELVENDLALMLSERFELSAARHSGSQDGLPLTNLPLPLNRLLGREFELEQASALLRQDEVSLVTLVGPGGSGKSRLGLQVALDLLDEFPDGAFLVALESVKMPTLVVPTIAHTLLAPEARHSASSPLDELIAHLRDRRILLLLDNLEQVLESGPDIATLLEHSPRLKVLATSRAPLRLRAERQLFVPPLAVPARDETECERLSQYAAVALFVERARAVKHEFTVTNETAPAVAEICHRLDGLPLAIELAAARVRMLPPDALLARLERRLDLLQGGARDLPERQHTMRGTIGWSYDLLDAPAQALFRWLSVFADTWSLEAAEEVCSGELWPTDSDVFDVMERLADSSLVVQRETFGGELRFAMLETIRDYAFERLVESEEEEESRRRLAGYYLSLAEQAEAGLRTEHQVWWIDRLEAEHNNIRSVLSWCRKTDAGSGLRLAGYVWRFWEMRNFMREGRGWLEAFLVASPSDAPGRSRALHAASALAAYQGDYDAAHRYGKEFLALARRQNDRWAIGTALHELAVVAMCRSDYAAAARLYERSLTIKRELGDERSIANSLGNLGLVAAYQGEYARAHKLHAESLGMHRRLNDTLGTAIASGNLGHDAMHLGRLDEARALQSESAQLFHRIGDLDGEAESLERLAMLNLAEHDPAGAARLFAAGVNLRVRADTLVTPAELAEREAAVEATRARLGPKEFEAAWQEGLALTRDQALELALAPFGSSKEQAMP